VAQRLDKAAAETEAAIAELRELGSGIRPQILTNRGVGAAVESLTGPLPIPVAIEIPERRFPESVEAAAYFVIAEGLTNVIKHAAAGSARVRLTRAADDSGIELEIVDDGVGGAIVLPRGGLAGIKDRVEALDGTMSVSSTRGAGTRLECALPIPRGS
jgi:signal transduction histidine kinase